MPNVFLQNDAIDTSFLSYKHPSISTIIFSFSDTYFSKYLGIIPDRSNTTDSKGDHGSELPQFTDIKMFVDSLLVKYQTNHSLQFELERKLMTCAPFHDDYLFSKIKIFIYL
jgi:hypothetical protein